MLQFILLNMYLIFLFMLFMILHCVKCVRIRSFSCPYFSAFALNMERNSGHFSRSVTLRIGKTYQIFSVSSGQLIPTFSCAISMFSRCFFFPEQSVIRVSILHSTNITTCDLEGLAGNSRVSDLFNDIDLTLKF